MTDDEIIQYLDTIEPVYTDQIKASLLDIRNKWNEIEVKGRQLNMEMHSPPPLEIIDQEIGHKEQHPRVHSLLYDGSTFTTLDIPTAGDVGFLPGTQANGINNSGQIVGFYGDNSGLTHGFLYSGGFYTTLDVPNSDFTSAVGINDNGIVVGYFYDNIGIHGFSYDGTNYTTIDNPSALAGFLPGTIVSGINNMGIMTGYVVGQGETPDQNFIYDGNSFSVIDVPNSYFARVSGINDVGQVVGWRNGKDGTNGGFLASPNAIPVPEPSVWLLILSGLGLMIIFSCSWKTQHRIINKK